MADPVEKDRIPSSALDLDIQAVSDPSSGFRAAPLNLDVSVPLHAVPSGLVPNMPDRIIAASALDLDIALLTAEVKIQASGIPTIW